MYTIISVSNPVYSNKDNTTVELQVVFNGLPNDLLPFTASPNDSEEHGRELYARAVAGEFGPIGAYVVPVITPASNQPQTNGTQTL